MLSKRLAQVLVYVGANVRRLRLLKGLTQAALSEAADLETRFVQQIEAAQTNITLATLVALADALNVEPQRLLRKVAPLVRKPGRPAKTKKRAATQKRD